MDLSEIISVKDIIYLVLLAILPLAVLGISILKPRGMYYITVGFGIFSLIALFTENYGAIGFYIIAYIGFSIFWAVKGGREYEACGHKFDIYRNLYASYYADDLNDDGIIDAFDNWKIAHDPRFAWIFASRKVRRERKEKGYFNFSFGVDSQAALNNKKRWSENDWSYGFGGSRDYSSSGQGSRTYSQGSNTYSQRSSTYSQRSSTYGRGSSTYGQESNSFGQSRDTDSMSEEERRVARQHAFAREHNLRYFAMCTSKDEGKKLYHKYAAKFHPDNAVTGNKDKFVAIDEEYNRFCAINDSEFVA